LDEAWAGTMALCIEEQASSGFASASRYQAQLLCDEANFTKQNRLMSIDMAAYLAYFSSFFSMMGL
jgi:hypothetical protein